MKNKLIFRILGALASALIIVSVFVPFVSVTGYSQSLWQAHSSVGTLYLPIMIIVFGSIGVIFFSINIKTELAYTSSGALLFFLIMQTIPIIDQGTFNTLGVGYYCLAIGTIVTGLMAFLCNLRTKQKVVEEVKVEEPKEISMINQIDKLYDNQSSRVEEPEINTLNNIIQPLQVQDNSLSIQTETTSNESANIDMETETTNQLPPVIVNGINSNDTSVALEDLKIEPQEQLKELAPSIDTEDVIQQNLEPIAPTIPEINNESIEQPESINPVVSEFSFSQQNLEPIAPTIPEINNESIEQPESINPVVAEFDIPVASQSSILNRPVIEPEIPKVEEPALETIQPLSPDMKIDVMADTTANNNSSNLDIFR